MSYDPQNIFAKILRGEVPCVKVFEDESVIAIMDVFPQANGHVLVIPKAASRNLFDIAPHELSALILRVQIIAKAAKQAFQADGITLSQFNESAGGQSVFHTHFHVMPRFNGIALGAHGGSGIADLEVLKTQAEQIKAALSANPPAA